jgi:6-phosphogluconolactonase
MQSIDGQVVRWHPVADAAALQQSTRRWILDAAARAIAARGRFVIVLAGGNTPRAAYAMLRDATTEWSRWEIWFGDERCAALDEPERNSVMARDAWLSHVAIPQDQVHVIAAERGADAAACAYADALRDIDDFDLVLLGIGEDGHTASLFPGHDWGIGLHAPDALAVFDAPKPPAQRVSLSAVRLSRAREVVFLVEGESKRDAARRWRERDNIPARAIRPYSGVDVLIHASLLLPRT